MGFPCQHQIIAVLAASIARHLHYMRNMKLRETYDSNFGPIFRRNLEVSY